MSLIFKVVKEELAGEAAILANQSYQREQKQCKGLYDSDYTKILEEKLKELFAVGNGLAAYEGDKMVGYLAFYQVYDGYFGEVKGTWSPSFGNAYDYEDRGKFASILFQKVSERLVKEEVFSYIIVTYAHDIQVESSLTLSGFGIRCSDAIRMVKEEVHVIKNVTYEYEELPKDKAGSLLELYNQLARHLKGSPTYYASLEADEETFMKRVLQENARYFIAKDHDRIIGYLKVGDEGETFVSEEADVKNICGAYFLQEYRGTEAAASLLSYVVDVLQEEGIERLGVDCETLNPTALRFWGKYFENYTYSFARRLDERVTKY